MAGLTMIYTKDFPVRYFQEDKQRVEYQQISKEVQFIEMKGAKALVLLKTPAGMERRWVDPSRLTIKIGEA